ncbi:uncharacterized protein LOC120516999 [Polypterus senegalus]|uniref:uncharacterized protein LOC120516999 n=1 Tax=Polypterus senegalus TaxID=55291 RepID=UPI0019659CAB|nr:uncharacterized protein LOC120516999 [Polypterus senegalus]
MHISVCTANSTLALKRCTTCCSQFHCPLCAVGNFKPTKFSRAQRHLKLHFTNGLVYDGYTICKCNLPCRKRSHFHCPKCAKTILRKHNMIAHLKGCRGSSSGPASVSSAEGQTPAPTLSLTKTGHLVVYQTPKRSLEMPGADTQYQTAVPAMHPEMDEYSHSDNGLFDEDDLETQLSETHAYSKRDITMFSHLPSVCLDANNGIAAVCKTMEEFCMPVHVQYKTWGKAHHVRCELEECRQSHVLAERSGFLFRLCEHVRSLDYCTQTATEVQLDKTVLEEMVTSIRFGEVKKEECLMRQKAAQEARVPFSLEVDLEMPTGHYCLSIHEPQVKQHCLLGRVFVMYNSKTNTWICSCAKPRRLSCPHKYIAKWHLFQTRKKLFKVELKMAAGEQVAGLRPLSQEQVQRESGDRFGVLGAGGDRRSLLLGEAEALDLRILPEFVFGEYLCGTIKQLRTDTASAILEKLSGLSKSGHVAPLLEEVVSEAMEIVVNHLMGLAEERFAHLQLEISARDEEIEGLKVQLRGERQHLSWEPGGGSSSELSDCVQVEDSNSPQSPERLHAKICATLGQSLKKQNAVPGKRQRKNSWTDASEVSWKLDQGQQ